MSKSNFFTAIRFITMVQNGDMPLSKGKAWALIKRSVAWLFYHHLTFVFSPLMSNGLALLGIRETDQLCWHSVPSSQVH
jgi:hypothetical protein